MVDIGECTMIIFLIGDYKTGTQKVTWGFGTNTGYNKGITFLDSAYVFFSKSLSNSESF